MHPIRRFLLRALAGRRTVIINAPSGVAGALVLSPADYSADGHTVRGEIRRVTTVPAGQVTWLTALEGAYSAN